MLRVFPFEPGDGTRYLVAWDPEPVCDPMTIGYKYDRKLVAFGIESAGWNFIPIALLPGDEDEPYSLPTFANRYPRRPGMSEWTYAAAYLAFCYLAGLQSEIDADTANEQVIIVYHRWENHTPTPEQPYWRDQLRSNADGRKP